MEIILISEENHGIIGVAANYRAAKQWLIRAGWVDCYTEFWNPITNMSSPLEELYGETWKEAYMNFDKEDMEYMGFYLRVEELIEEETEKA